MGLEPRPVIEALIYLFFKFIYIYWKNEVKTESEQEAEKSG